MAKERSDQLRQLLDAPQSAQSQSLGTLAVTIFGRIAQGGEAGASGLFAAEAMIGYAASIGSAVDTPQVQNMVDRMI